jgi:hypothetical protein
MQDTTAWESLSEDVTENAGTRCRRPDSYYRWDDEAEGQDQTQNDALHGATSSAQTLADPYAAAN